MFEYLEKFNNLNPGLKEAVSSPEAVAIIESLENEFNIDLASLVMRVMVKDIQIEMLPLAFFTEFGLNQEKSEQLSEKLKEQVFYKVADYLGFIQKKEEVAKDLKKEEVEKNIEQKEVIKEKNNLEEDFSPSEDLLKQNQDFLNNYQKEEYQEKIDNNISQIIKKLSLKFKSQESQNKFLSILTKYLRGIKDRSSIREIFTANIDSGGFGLKDKMVDDIFMVIEEIKDEEYSKIKKDLKPNDDILKKIEKLSHGKISSESNYGLLPKEDFSYEIEAPELKPLSLPVIKKEEEQQPESIKTEIKDIKIDDLEKNKKDLIEKIQKDSLPSLLSQKEFSLLTEKKPEDNLKEDKIEFKKEFEEIDNKKTKPSPRIDMITDNSGKIRMTDIKKIRVTGPVDELKYMDLVNFHRLSKDPNEAFEKISQKLKVLENIDYSKMLEGIKAWRQSPVNRLYLRIFSKASDDGISVDRVIENLKSSNQEYLSKEEIDALIKFNKTLVF